MQGITQPTPTHHRGQKMLPPTRIKKEGLFFEKKAAESSSESRGAKIGFRFLFGFRFDFLPAPIGGASLRGQKKTRHGGRVVLVIVATIGGRAVFVFPTIAHGRQCRRVVLVVLLSGRSRSGLGNTRTHTGARFPHLCDL